jgi:DNA-directed RNA polymerase subunit RPC12/RpoP
MSENIVTIETYDSVAKAHLAKSKLEAFGIECFLADENIIGLNPLYNQAIGGIKLKIFEKDYQAASEILEEKYNIDTEEESNSEIVCPNCGSTNVAYGFATKKKFGFLTLIVSFLLLIYPFHMRKSYHCYNCNFEFTKQKK